MNTLSEIVKPERIQAMKNALSELSQRGCDVIGVNLNHAGVRVEIIPPSANALNGEPLRIVGGINNNKHITHYTRLRGCDVFWTIHQ